MIIENFAFNMRKTTLQRLVDPMFKLQYKCSSSRIAQLPKSKATKM